MKLFIAITMIIFALLSGYYYIAWHRNLSPTHTVHYVGSKTCQACHPLHFTAQSHTLHTKIFHPVQSPDEILGDFTTPNPLVTFKKEDIEFVVGSAWEQVYLYRKGEDLYPFPAKWMVLTKEWVPFKIHTSMQTPASTHCNGCHTTGYNPKTHDFVEYGVRCEACHGPGGLHVAHMTQVTRTDCLICHEAKHPEGFKGDLVVSVKNSLCGQCHTRGKTVIQTDHGEVTAFNFPIRYLSHELNATFVPSTLESDPKQNYWWNNRLAKKRHQEFADFSLSKHARALKDLHQKPNPHNDRPVSDACLQCHSQDYRSAPKNHKPTLVTAQEGLTCVTCHEPHGLDRSAPSLLTASDRCGACHLSPTAKGEIERYGASHFPCPSDQVTCVDCHMPRIVKSGGTFSMHSHAFKIVPPEATKQYGMPNSCQNGACHQDRTTEWAIDAYRRFYKPQETLQAHLKGVK
jgi:hypothetical protein